MSSWTSTVEVNDVPDVSNPQGVPVFGPPPGANLVRVEPPGIDPHSYSFRLWR